MGLSQPERMLLEEFSIQRQGAIISKAIKRRFRFRREPHVVPFRLLRNKRARAYNEYATEPDLIWATTLSNAGEYGRKRIVICSGVRVTGRCSSALGRSSALPRRAECRSGSNRRRLGSCLPAFVIGRWTPACDLPESRAGRLPRCVGAPL